MPSFVLWVLAAVVSILFMGLFFLITPFFLRLHLAVLESRITAQVHIRPGFLPLYIPVFKLDTNKPRRKKERTPPIAGRRKKMWAGKKKTQTTPGLKGLFSFLRRHTDDIKGVLDLGLRGTEITRLDVRISVGLDDASLTALITGGAKALLGLGIKVLEREGLRIRGSPTIEVVPHYEAPVLRILAQADIKIKPYRILLGLFSLRQVIYKARTVEY